MKTYKKELNSRRRLAEPTIEKLFCLSFEVNFIKFPTINLFVSISRNLDY